MPRSYMAVIASLLALIVVLHVAKPQRESVLAELREGGDYIRGFRPIWSILLLLALISLVGMPYTTLMPIFAGKILHGDAHTLGFLMAAVGVGALIGAVTWAARRSVLGLGRVIPLTAVGFGAGLVATGYCFRQQMASSNTLLQTIIENTKRGRVMSFYAISFQGVAPFGSLIAGAVAAKIGAPRTLTIGGAICVCGAASFAAELPTLRRLARPIYARIGIIPEVAKGIQAASVLQEPPQE